MSQNDYPRVESLRDFIEWTEQFINEEHLFRGVSNEAYMIEPSTYLRMHENHRNESKLLQVNKEMIETARSRGHGRRDGERLSDLELLAQLQHYGAATCLIDFTRSGFVALWMACRRSSKGNSNGKVFAVPCDSRWEQVDSKTVKKDLDYFFRSNNEQLQIESKIASSLYMWEPQPQNNRIIAQHSVFGFGSVPIDTEKQCVIPEDRKIGIQNSLKTFNIDEATIFPDFDGLARLHAYDKPYVDPGAAEYRRHARDAEKRGEYELAIENYSKAIDLDPEDATAYLLRALIYHRNGKYDCAIEDYNKLINRNPEKSPFAYFFRGRNHLEKGDFGLAIDDFTAAINQNLANAATYAERGLAYYRSCEFQHAIDDYDEAIKLNPHSFQSYLSRGVAHETLGKLVRAIEDYNRALAVSNREVEGVVHYTLGRTWLRMKKWDKAKVNLTMARDKGADIIAYFSRDYDNVSSFEEEHEVKIPEHISNMLTVQ